jgi:hypothetical protein
VIDGRRLLNRALTLQTDMENSNCQMSDSDRLEPMSTCVDYEVPGSNCLCKISGVVYLVCTFCFLC